MILKIEEISQCTRKLADPTLVCKEIKATDNSNVLVSIVIPEERIPKDIDPGTVVKASKFMEP
jgi:hypothetical protein